MSMTTSLQCQAHALLHSLPTQLVMKKNEEISAIRKAGFYLCVLFPPHGEDGKK